MYSEAVLGSECYLWSWMYSSVFTSPGWSFRTTSQEHQQGATVCPLKVTCDSCHTTVHLVTLVPKSFLCLLSLDTTHDKMLAKSFICPVSHTHTICYSA